MKGEGDSGGGRREGVDLYGVRGSNVEKGQEEWTLDRVMVELLERI